MFEYTVWSKCTALLNRSTEGSEGFGHWLSAHALRLTTYYHVPEYLDSVPEVRKLIQNGA